MTENKVPAKKATAKKTAAKKIENKPVIEEIFIEDVVINDLVIEDPASIEEEIVDIINAEDVVVYMKSGYSYSSPEYEFTVDSPFQRLTSGQATELIQSIPERFELATKDQVNEFYTNGLG